MSELRKIFVGQPVPSFPANTWNKLLAGEERDRARRKFHPQPTNTPHQPFLVHLRWDGEEPIGPGRAVKIGDALFEPDTDEDEIGPGFGLCFSAEPFEEGDKLENYALTLGPVEAADEDDVEDGIAHMVWAMMPDAWWAIVNITDGGHKRAKLSGDDLVSSASSGLKILWKPSGTGEKWVVLLIGGGGGDVNLKYGRAEEDIDSAIGWAIEDAGTGDWQEVDDDGLAVGEPVEVINRYFKRIREGQPLWILFNGDTGIVVNVGCGTGPEIEEGE